MSEDKAAYNVAPEQIDMQAVESSQIAAIGHDEETNTLRVRFTGAGSEYDYANVTAEQFAEFKAAGSIGRHFGQHFKSNAAHPYTKRK